MNIFQTKEAAMRVMMKSVLLGAGIASLALVKMTPVQACESVNSCTLKDYSTAASSTGCGLLFIDSRKANCASAGASLHTDTSCGPIGTSPPACTNTNRDRHAVILQRWQTCLSDREAQAAAFASGLSDIEKARKVRYNFDAKAALKTIEAAIEAGQPGHATQIRGVKVSIENCKRFQ